MFASGDNLEGLHFFPACVKTLGVLVCGELENDLGHDSVSAHVCWHARLPYIHSVGVDVGDDSTDALPDFPAC